MATGMSNWGSACGCRPAWRAAVETWSFWREGCLAATRGGSQLVRAPRASTSQVRRATCMRGCRGTVFMPVAPAPRCARNCSVRLRAGPCLPMRRCRASCGRNCRGLVFGMCLRRRAGACVARLTPTSPSAAPCNRPSCRARSMPMIWACVRWSMALPSRVDACVRGSTGSAWISIHSACRARHGEPVCWAPSARGEGR